MNKISRPMYTYSVYFNPAESDEDVIIVCDSNSFWAGVLNIFWAAYNKLWPAFIAALLFTISFETLEIMEFSIAARTLELSLIGIFYFCAYDIECFCLEKKGYKLKEIIWASNEDEVELKYRTQASASQTQHGQS